MRKRRKNRILRRLVLGLAVAAFVVPTTAQAYPVEGTPGTHGSAVVIQGDDKELVPPVGPGVIQGDDKVLGPRGNHFAGPVRGDDKVIVVTPEVAPVEAVRSPSSFDWGDALIGAGTAFALMLLAGTAVLAMRHGRPATA